MCLLWRLRSETQWKREMGVCVHVLLPWRAGRGGNQNHANDCDMMAGKLCAASGQWQRTRTDNDAERCLAPWFRGSGREML